jgi:CDP-paratose 2-epimerase
MKRLLVTGSSGLIGSEVVDHFCSQGWQVHGIDNNLRRDFFGPAGDTRWNQARLLVKHKNFHHHELDVRDRTGVQDCVATLRPEMIVHTAAQPSHDLAARRPFDDFDVNAVGTLNVLEAARQSVPETVFVHMSTNKVYGDRPNHIPLKELETRWEYDASEYANGIAEDFPIDQSKHSLFGASKVAADVMVQEYGRYFGLKSCCLRGGCLTGPNHSSAELHGFLAYVARAIREGLTYRIYGYKGKQVRDNIHSYDVCTAIMAFAELPRAAAVYNLGGGRGNSCSILEAIAALEELHGRKLATEYVDQNRRGDHICYISDLGRFRSDYPQWDLSLSLDEIYEQLARIPAAA